LNVVIGVMLDMTMVAAFGVGMHELGKDLGVGPIIGGVLRRCGTERSRSG
jgi:hypothetical protein